MICYLFLFLLPLVICLPLQQQQQPTELSTTNQMILYDDIQGYYENILDEIISTQSEDLLVRLSNAKNDMDQLTSLLQPQANALLSSSSFSSSNTLNPTCLQRMPSMIAHQLHDIHSEMMSSVEPSLQSVFSRHFDFSKKELNDMTPEEFYTQLKALHQELSHQLLSLFKHQPLEKELTQALIQCEQQQTINQLHDEKKKAMPDVWSFLRGWLNNGFSTTPASEKKQRKVKMMAELNNKMIKKDQLVIVVNGNNYHHYEPSPYQDQDEQDDDSFITSGPTLLQSYLNLIYDSLTLEFDARLLDLYNTLRSDVFDEDSVM
ncbi:hypothetical protein BJ944DRAFT_274150 [Cunninghamella echinulata]|nr:hypothetical protein BJ944DRAFT_274150 [Cunninghamella echinulata]